MTEIERLITDAEYVWDGLKWAEPGRGTYISADLSKCCGVGAAALLSLTKEELYEESWNPDRDGIHSVLRAKYGVTDDQLAGFYDGFDGVRRVTESMKADGLAGYRAGQELARRRFVNG